MNPVISKTSKVHIFTESSLKQLGQLYIWKGPERWKDGDQKKTEAEIEVVYYCPILLTVDMLFKDETHFYLVKLGFTWVYLIFALKHRLRKNTSCAHHGNISVQK